MKRNCLILSSQMACKLTKTVGVFEVKTGKSMPFSAIDNRLYRLVDQLEDPGYRALRASELARLIGKDDTPQWSLKTAAELPDSAVVK